MLKTLRTFVNISRTRKDLWINPVQWCFTRTNGIVKNNCETISSRTNDIVENNCETIFSNKQNHILNILNTSSLDILTRYIQEPYAEKIIQHRTENGPFKSLNDLTRIQNIELDVLNGLWIAPNTKQLSKLKRSLIMPRTKITTVPNEILSLHIGTSAVSWAVVTSDFKILQLDFINWSSDTRALSIFELINLVPLIAKLLPPSSSYVTEEFVYSNKLGSKYFVQQKLLTAILSCVKILNEERNKSPSLKNDFYILRKQTAAHFFNLVVGGETIASRYIIGKILHNSNSEIKPFENIYINDELRSNFINVTSEQQEQVGWSLLKAITGMYLIKLFRED
ncbi:hypothetical protein ANTRET_LOCUS9192 [Anthophora retusa]